MNEDTERHSQITEHNHSLVQEHFGRIARRLKAEGDAAKSFDHGTNRGQIREAFIREFLSHNTSPLTGIGTGEIVHTDSKPDERRNQIDVVVHSNRYPKISLAAGIDLFFAETVSSFIEIKSCLTKEDVKNAARTTRKIKETCHPAPQKLNPTGMVKNPRPYSFIFAYDGPARIETVLNWMKQVSAEGDYNLDQLRNTPGEGRPFFNHLFIDGVFILNKGYVCLDTLPFDSILHLLNQQVEQAPEDHIWFYGKKSELLRLWTLVTELSEKYLWTDIDLTGYMGMFHDTPSD